MPISSSIPHQHKQYNTGTTLTGPMINDNNNFLSSSHHHHQHQQQQQQQQQQQHLASYQQQHHHHHHHHALQQYCPPTIQAQFNNYHYMNNYPSETPATVYISDGQSHFPNHHFEPQPTYSSYDSNNNYGEQHQQQQYGLLRPAIDSEVYSNYYSNDVDTNSSTANENLLHNLNTNNSTNTVGTPHYTDLTAISNNGKHYEFVATNDLDHQQKDDEQCTLTRSNENNFHWNQTTCLATQW